MYVSESKEQGNNKNNCQDADTLMVDLLHFTALFSLIQLVFLVAIMNVVVWC